MKQRAGASTREDRATIWVVFWFGALWGAAEALAGGLFHLVLPPTYAGRLMLLVAGSLCTYAIRVTGRPGAPLAMAAVAAPLKLLSAAVFGIPVVMPVILNPFFSILSEGAAFALLATWLLRRLAPSPSRFAVFGVSAGALQAPLFIACAVASMAFAAYSPMAELQRRLRLVMSWYISVAIIVTAFGLLMATLLRPVEDLDVDHGAVVSWFAVLALAGMAIATVLYLLEGAEGSRLGSTRGYHIAMLVLVAISACALIVIAVFIVPAVDRARGGYLATGEWVVGLVNSPMISAGLGLALLGAMGVLFALPALAGAMATEFLLGLREAEGRR